MRSAFLETADQTSPSDYRPIMIGTRSIRAPLVKIIIMGCEKIINKKSGAAMRAGSLRTASIFHPSGMTPALAAKKTDRPTGNPPGAPD